jgi:HAD superfamily hydrolase (TIGR01662 family)
MIRGVIFDLGETLIRFRGDWPNIFEHSRQQVFDYLAAAGYDLPQDEFSQRLLQKVVAAQDIRDKDFIERPTDQIFRGVMADYGFDNLPDELVLEAMEHLYQRSEEHWQPVPELEDILVRVAAQGVRMGLISNASDVANVDRLIDKAGVRRFFDPILVSAGVGVRKPAPLIFQQLLAQWDLPARQTVMVGDSLNADILGAQRLGMHQIWLRTAKDRPDNLAWLDRLEPEAQADRLDEVPAVLDELNQS